MTPSNDLWVCGQMRQQKVADQIVQYRWLYEGCCKQRWGKWSGWWEAVHWTEMLCVLPGTRSLSKYVRNSTLLAIRHHYYMHITLSTRWDVVLLSGILLPTRLLLGYHGEAQSVVKGSRSLWIVWSSFCKGKLWIFDYQTSDGPVRIFVSVAVHAQAPMLRVPKPQIWIS